MEVVDSRGSADFGLHPRDFMFSYSGSGRHWERDKQGLASTPDFGDATKQLYY